MERSQLVGILLGLCTGAGCSSTESDDTPADTETVTMGTSHGQTANGTTVGQTASTSSSVTATTSSSSAAGGSDSTATSTDATNTAAADTTGAGGAAGNANTTSATTTAAGGGGGEAAACPNEAPSPDSSCASLDALCAYEDCGGVGRTLASCVDGSWVVTTNACGEAVYCSAGGGQCSEGEICLIVAGGAFMQECVPNTCETGPIACDCIEGCNGNCTTHPNPDSGITISCNTCPSGMACP